MHTTENIHLTQPVAHCEAWEAERALTTSPRELAEAAGPDLLAALKSLWETCGESDHPQYGKARLAASAAISKAEGNL